MLFLRIVKFLRDDRIDCFLWLLCTAILAGLGFWYPESVAHANASPDDRFGFVLLTALPFDVMAAIIAARQLIKLFSAHTSRKYPGTLTLWLRFLGTGLAIYSCSPVAIIATRMLG